MIKVNKGSPVAMYQSYNTLTNHTKMNNNMKHKATTLPSGKPSPHQTILIYIAPLPLPSPFPYSV